MSNKDFTPWVISHKATLNLKSFDTQPPSDERWEDKYKAENMQKLGEKLGQLQGLMHASKTRGLLLVLQGMDTAGKDGAIRHVFNHVSPLGVRAEAFGAPTEQELEHDFLWRIHQKTPALGEIVVFNRSHYEDVLVTRVKGWISREVCEKRFEHIRAFEMLLHDQGIKVIKCFLNISKDEQRKRLRERMDDPHKQWKLQPSDFEDRKLWDQFGHAYQDALKETSTPESPWYVIPADSKHYRDLFLTELLISTLDQMQLKVPKPKFDLTSVKLD